MTVRTDMPRHVLVAGGSLAVHVAGSGSPLLFIHGWTLDHRAWWPQIGAFRETHRAVSYDRRGCGSSTAPPNLRLEVDDVALLLDALEIEQAAIVALSQGCRIALGFALQRPERVSALVLAGAPSPHRPAHDASEGVPIDAMRALAVSGDLDALRQMLRAHPLMRLGIGADPALLESMIRTYDGRDLLEPAATLTLDEADLLRLTVPTLLLVGEQDSSARHSAAAELAARLPQGTAQIVAEAHHLCNLSHPARFNAAVTTFLEMHHGH